LLATKPYHSLFSKTTNSKNTKAISNLHPIDWGRHCSGRRSGNSSCKQNAPKRRRDAVFVTRARRSITLNCTKQTSEKKKKATVFSCFYQMVQIRTETRPISAKEKTKSENQLLTAFSFT
jgi:hypothetical protein